MNTSGKAWISSYFCYIIIQAYNKTLSSYSLICYNICLPFILEEKVSASKDNGEAMLFNYSKLSSALVHKR